MMLLNRWIAARLFKPLVFVACLLPLSKLVWDGVNGGLGSNPAEMLIRNLGDWGLYFLLIGLAVTPVRKMLKASALIRVRRMLGLFAFFYASLHFLAYIWFEQYFNVGEIIKDIIKRPFITVGFINYLALLPLAITSNMHMIRKLKANWGRLHRLVYPVSMLAILHYYMMTKVDYLMPAILFLLLLCLFAYRLLISIKKAR